MGRPLLVHLFERWHNFVLGLAVARCSGLVPKSLLASASVTSAWLRAPPDEDVCVTPDQLWSDTEDGF